MPFDSESTQREIATFLEHVAKPLPDAAIEARAYQLAHPYTDDDYESLAGRLADADTIASFDFLARDLPESSDAIDLLADAGHEIVLHGYRHTAFADASYSAAYDILAKSLDLFDDTTTVRPTGFHVPFMDTSEGTLRAAAELGIEWILGRPTTENPTEIAMYLPVPDYDIYQLQEGATPHDTFATLSDSIEPHAVFLCHPNIHPYYEATSAFDDWLATHAFGAIRDFTESTGGGVLIDNAPQLRIT